MKTMNSTMNSENIEKIVRSNRQPVSSAILLSILAAVLVALATSFSFAANPVPIDHRDPLRHSVSSIKVQWIPNGRVPAEKMTPALHRKVAGSSLEAELKVIVTLVDPVVAHDMNTVGASAQELAREGNAVLEREFLDLAEPLGFTPRVGLWNVPVVVGVMRAGQIRELAALDIVRAVEPDFEIHAMRTEGAALMHADTLRVQGGDGEGIGVAVIDSGIDWTHPELPGGTKVVAHGDYTGTQSGDITGFDDKGHGTAVAGIVAGLQGGMAPKATLWALKVLDSHGHGDFSFMLAALDDAFTNKDNLGGIKVINMSLGGGGPFNSSCDDELPSMKAIMAKLVNAGIAIFVSSGNDGCTNGISAPACISDAISVGAVYDADLGGIAFEEGKCMPEGCSDPNTGPDVITCYSNSGNPLDILAPSHCSVTPKMGGGYESCFGGTSAAAPYAAGVAAQLYTLHKDLTVAQLKQALTSTGRSITDPRNGVTRKRIDAVQADQYLAGGGGGGGSGGGSNVAWVPVVVHASGKKGTNWKSDVSVLNLGSGPASLTFTLYVGNQPIRLAASGTLGPGQMLIFPDLVAAMSATGAGAVKIESDQPIMVASRTYNTVGSSTYGQFLDAFTPADGLGTGQKAILTHLQEWSAFRTNIGLVNLSDAPASVTVSCFAYTGTSLGQFSVNMAPGQWYQDQQPFAKRFGQTNTTGYAVVSVTSGGGIIAYASVIDNVSGDPTTIPMKR